MSSSQSVCLCKKVFEFLIRFSAAMLHTARGVIKVLSGAGGRDWCTGVG